MRNYLYVENNFKKAKIMKWLLFKYTENAFFYNQFVTECLFLILGLYG